jgi:hypothetical protein
MKIKTSCHPYGFHDYWTAIDDDTYTGPASAIGVGRTEAKAIADLKEQLESEHE